MDPVGSSNPKRLHTSVIDKFRLDEPSAVGSCNGIRGNSLAPGFFATEMTDQYPDGYSGSIAARLLLDRMGDPAEIAATLVCLLSDAGDYVTGQTVVFDGGFTIT